MKGLLLKDFFTLGKQMRFFLALIVLFALLPGASMSAFAIVYAAMLPMTALAYDERAKWNELAAMMPYTEGQLVGSKYVLGFIGIAGAFVLSLAAQAVTGLIHGTVVSWADGIALLAIVCIAVLIQAITMPCLFRFGVEKGRLYVIVFMAVLALLVGVGGSDAVMEFLSNEKVILVLGIALPFAAAAGTVVSVRVSGKIYRKKFGG